MSEENQSRYDDLTERYEDLVERASFEREHNRSERLGERIRELPGKIEDIRERGYAYRVFLEEKAEKFESQWEDAEQKISDTISNALDDLGSAINRPKALITNAERQLDNDNIFEKLADQAENAVDNLEEAVEAAQESVENVFGNLEDDVDSTYRQLREIEWILDKAEEITFDLGDGENIFLAAEAELILTGKGRKDPDGILFLTNQRLVFEQRETTGKALGMFGGKREHEVEWETPLGAVNSITTENKGLFRGKDILHFGLSEGDMNEVTVEVKGRADNEFWRKQVQRMISGDATDERAIETDDALAEAVKSGPAECPICSAKLPTPEAGDTEIACQYCGSVVKLA